MTTFGRGKLNGEPSSSSEDPSVVVPVEVGTTGDVYVGAGWVEKVPGPEIEVNFDDGVDVAIVIGTSGGKTTPGALSWALPSITWQFWRQVAMEIFYRIVSPSLPREFGSMQD